MNALEKIFSSIKNAPTEGLKLYNTKSLLNQIKEYEEYTLFILKNIYSLLISESTLNRNCGALILNAMDIFEYSMDFRIRKVETSDYVYLQFKDIAGESKCLNKAEEMRQRREMKAKLELEHVEADFLDSIELGENKLSLNHKTAEYKEKNIENVYDFFEAVSLILLSPDWFKRHGGFVGYAAMVTNALGQPFEIIPGEDFGGKSRAKDRAGKIRINLEGDLFNIIFEILRNDKFSDFQDDRTFSPVRESASLLLKCIYPLLNNETILLEISNLLTSEDWQEQFSGLIALSHLKEHFSEDLVQLSIFGENKSNLVDLLMVLLDSDDEDVKYISADLLSDIAKRFLKKRKNVSDGDATDELKLKIQTIKDKCWNQIENEIDIAHSKASLIILLKTLYENFPLDPPGSFSSLYPCFTSSNSLIRNSVLELSQIFDGCEFLYLLGEGVLLQTEGKGTVKEADQSNKLGIVDILERKILSSAKETLSDFGTHFMKLIARDSNLPYLEDDFGCYDESFFTKGGISFIGNAHNLNNKATLFRIIRNIPGVVFGTDKSMLLESFKGLYEYYSGHAKRVKSNEANSNESDICTLDAIILKSIQIDFSQFPVLKKMPMKEFKSLILDPFYLALYPFSHDYCLEYIRMHVISILKDTKYPADYSLYFILENSVEFLKEVCNALILSCIDGGSLGSKIEHIVDVLWKKLVELHKEKDFVLISKKNMEIFSKSKKTSNDVAKSHQEIMLDQGMGNISCFFSVLGERLFTLESFNKIMSSEDRIVFFEHTVVFYTRFMNSALTEVFTESLAKKNTRILREFLGAMHFNQLFVKHILDNFDYSLLSSLLDYSDPSFNVLFVKPLLKSRDKASDPSTLSKIICSIHLEVNEKIDDKELLQLIEQEKAEVEMIVNPSLIKDYEIRVQSRIVLRDYQKEGIKWLAFLFKFNLNGILADDMGLGKTVQALSYLINEMASDDVKKEDTNKAAEDIKHKALILCPSSLTSHWKDEIFNCFGKKSCIYDSKNNSPASNIVICSYDTLRRDSSLEKKNWFMIVFDEGHVLKNRGTVLYTKVKGLKSDKKVILTGTPVHNSVEDLFSLFEVIMPSYLGTESEFLSQYNCKVTDKNFQVMEKRLESLHKKTLPFIMRRLKSDVLKDLPPKIIKDIIVDLNSEQAKLYSSFQGEDGTDIECSENTSGYNYLKNSSLTKTKDLLKLASHPHHFTDDVSSAKSAALLDIFNMCGGESNQKKILIFFQFKKTIDFVIEDLKQTYENFKYLRLDGSVPISQRGDVVSKFNSESVPFLFLTTSIGGLGLNLTSADTVVFYEHDWNPFNDLQAMDRAHRLGQKNVVNVFRLIAKNTIEEKVMNYQNFKLYVANTLVSQQNNEIETMGTKDLLERFQ